MKFRAFYVVLGNLRDGLSYPFDRADSQSDAETIAKQRPGAQVLTATQYRELTGRTAAADYRREMAD